MIKNFLKWDITWSWHLPCHELSHLLRLSPLRAPYTLWMALCWRGHPFMTYTKNQIFDLSPNVHMGPHEPDPLPLWTSTYGRHEIHIALLQQLVQWPSRPKAEIRLYDCNFFNTVLLVIFITNLYRQKMSTFYSVQRWNSGKKDANFFAREEDRMTSVDSNFNFLCGHPHGAWPILPSPSTWAWPLPLCVDVINGWPLFCLVYTIQPLFDSALYKVQNQKCLLIWAIIGIHS